MPPRVALQSIVKAFAGVVALKGVDLEVRPGEIHALCGENGAGKSTLMNILGGVIRPDRGSITIDGVALDFRGPIDALRNGVAVIHQELSLVNSLTVAENLMLGHESHIGPWIRRRAMVREAQHLLDRLDFPIDPTSRVADLPIGTRQLVEIAKALGRSARVVVLDEPTAALTRAEGDRLFHALADLKKQQIAIVYISHHLDEVAQIADRVTVLRDGQKVGTWMASELSTEQLIQEMLGHDVKIAPKIERASLRSQPCWVVRDAHGKSLQGVDLTVHQGEVVGLTGLAGAGHGELAAIAFGAERLQHGQMSLLGKPYAPGHPGQAMTLGVASVPGDRRRQGLIPTLDIADNLTLTLLERFCLGPFLNRRRLRASAAQWCDEFEVARASLSQRVITLSGGNQQKVLLARWVSREPRFLIVNEPTRGIDVKTREAIHRRLELLSQQGLGILLVTSDTQELVRMADRVVVVRDGRVAGEIARNAMTEGAIVAAMMGAAS